MSAIGTGIAASVAQVGLQSQQVARQHDNRESSRTRQAQRDSEVFKTRLLGLEEHDGDEQATRLHVDNQQPDHDHAQDEGSEDHAPDDEQAPASQLEAASSLPDADTLLRQLAATADPALQRRATAQPASGAPGSLTDPDTLYAHIDIQA